MNGVDLTYIAVGVKTKRLLWVLLWVLFVLGVPVALRAQGSSAQEGVHKGARVLIVQEGVQESAQESTLRARTLSTHSDTLNYSADPLGLSEPLTSSEPLPSSEPHNFSDADALPEELIACVGALWVQDAQGRITVLSSYASQLLRKLTHTQRWEGMRATQWLLVILSEARHATSVPMLYVGDPSLRRRFAPHQQKHVSLSSLYDNYGNYLLAPEVEAAHRTPSELRTRTQREVLKLDERVQILTQLLRGGLLPLLPISTTRPWYSAGDPPPMPSTEELQALFALPTALFEAVERGDYPAAQGAVEELSRLQHARASAWGLSPARLHAEGIYHHVGIFRWCFRAYLLLGVALLLLVLLQRAPARRSAPTLAPVPASSPASSPLTPSTPTSTPLTSSVPSTPSLPPRSWAMRLLLGALLLTFLLHGLGMLLRGYLLGHVPLSNSYETMVAVSWFSLLWPWLLCRTRPFVLALGALLAGVVLFVANLSWLDPQLTLLVPVLNSPWLMIHVSLITASYGFLGLSALLGLSSLVAIASGRSGARWLRINELSMQLGVLLLLLGILFGAVWANESWGRYWGWDPKESWALVTLLIYSLILHLRHLHLSRHIFLFHLLSVWALYSVGMTLFGVNYLLSGLHSYGHSEGFSPLPILLLTLLLLLLSLLAARRIYCR